MSQSSITQLEHELIADYASRAANALFLYECVITLTQEVNVIWHRKWTATTWLYAFTHYVTVLDQIILLLPVRNFASCAGLSYTDAACELIRYLCIAWFSAVRIYALLDGKYVIAGIALALNLVPFATNLFNFSTSILLEDVEICTAIPGISPSLLMSLSLFTRISVVIGDALVLAVTWIKTARAYRDARRLNLKAPLATILFRDGTIYFLILLVINVLEVIELNNPTLLTLDLAGPFYNILPQIIIGRFILNLRQIEPGENSQTSENQSRSLRFVGNIGQSLQFGGGSVDRDEEASVIEATYTEADADISPEIAIGTTECEGE